MFVLLVLAVAVCGYGALFRYVPVAYADYSSLVATASLTGIASDTQTIAVWIVGILCTICALGILYKIFSH